MSRINEEEVRKALGKKAAYGDDIDMEKYDEGEKDVEQIESLEDTPDDLQKKMINVGVDTDDSEKDGTILFINNAMSHCSNKAQDGLIIMSTQKAMETYSWVKDYYWNAMDPAKDKYTAKTYEEKSDGYFIYVKPGHHLKFPVQTCMMLGQDKSVQNLHNIIVVDDDASCDMITGCTTVHSANDALHVGVSEMYIGENSSLSFTMIHSWNNETAVRPRTNVVMKKNARYVNNYVSSTPSAPSSRSRTPTSTGRVHLAVSIPCASPRRTRTSTPEGVRSSTPPTPARRSSAGTYPTGAG